MINIFGIEIVEAVWLVYILFWFITAFFTKKTVEKRNWGFTIWWRVLIIIFVIVYIKSSKSGAQNLNSFFAYLFQSPPTIKIIGLIILLLGFAGAIWARIYLGRNWSGYVTYKEDHELVTTGPYRFIRHPIYTSMLLMLVGTFIYYGYYFILWIFVIWGILFLWRVKREEEIMIKLFGKKYTDYMKKTKRLIPGVW